MLTEAEIKKNHEICLELLDKFIDICAKNGINYYMAFGSCLGTVRHKGFIPWDINIDVLMKWEDYYLLDAVMKKENLGRYKWCCPENDTRIFPLLCRDDYLDYESNPNIDVALYVNAPKTRLMRDFVRKIAYFNIKMYKLKNTNVQRTFPYNILKGICSIIPNKLYISVAKSFSKIKKNEAGYMMVVLPSVWDDREHLKVDWIGESPLFGEFEGRKVMMLNNYHDYLTMRYGSNYMTPKVWKDKGEYKHVKNKRQDRI